ncbi:hypothetical protein [Leptospira interrogans]|uniref:hypothetical protein n=1 Tax=Leptospira interrogans TaxID=173 RepID=UPI000344A83A|nr:hypothetical protein [Leptospira interrogans]
MFLIFMGRWTYESMGFGGGSPLVSETNKQAAAITQILKKITGEIWERVLSCIRDILRFLIPRIKILYFHYILIFPDPPF